MATITLDYFIDSDSVPMTVLLARAQAADLFKGELDLLGYTLTSYLATQVAGPRIRARVILATTTQSDSLFPTNAQRSYSTKNLYRAALANQIPSLVTAADPVIT